MNNVFFVIAETRFTGDENKNLSNQLEQEGISFALALRVFRDPLRLTRQDRIEDHEERWQTIGVVHGITLLLVAHAIIEEDKDGQHLETIGIISACKANKSERNRYEEERG